MSEGYTAFDDVVVVRTVSGDEYRVSEIQGSSATSFAQKIARDGIWITGERTLWIPAHQVAHVELMRPEEWQRRQKGARFT